MRERRLPVFGEWESVPERRDAAESRGRILSAARELFERKGVDAVSMYEIGRAAGVGQGTLYRRFAHKGELCLALLRESISRFTEEVAQEVEDEREPALKRLVRLLEQLASFTERNAALLGAVRDASGGERRTEIYQSPFYGWLRAVTAWLLGRAVERGEARGDLDVEAVADSVLAPLNVELYEFQRRELGLEVERVVRALSGLLLEGLRARSVQPETGAGERESSSGGSEP